MQPEQTPDNTHNPDIVPKPEDSRRNQSETPSLQQPERSPTRNLEEHHPMSLCFHNVSSASLELLLSEMLPEVAPIVAECLRQTVLNEETIPYNTLIESYVDLTPYSITQIRHFEMGQGPAVETVHRMIIERHTEEEPSVFELSLGNTKPRSVDFKIAYSWMNEADRWENVNAWGALLGIDSLSSLFSDTPPELYEVDEMGYCTSLLPGDISIRTEAATDPQAPQEDPSHQASSSAHWIPRSIQISSPLYSEQAEVLRRLSPDVSAMIVESGLLPTIDAFAGDNAELQKRLLDRASLRSPTEFTIEFSRLVHLGPAEAEQPDEDSDSDEHCGGIDGPEGFSTDEDRDERQSADPDEPPFSAHPLAYRVSSMTRVQLTSDLLGLIQLEHRSCGEPHGAVLIHHSELYNFAVPTIGYTFMDESPSLREIAARWRVVRAIAPVGEVKIDRKDLESNLFFSATTPGGQAVSADIGAHRVLMAFDPPHKVDASQDAIVEE